MAFGLKVLSAPDGGKIGYIYALRSFDAEETMEYVIRLSAFVNNGKYSGHFSFKCLLQIRIILHEAN